jgi:hypothetical protein
LTKLSAFSLTVDNWHLSAAEMLQEIQHEEPGTKGWKEEARLKTEAQNRGIKPGVPKKNLLHWVKLPV